MKNRSYYNFWQRLHNSTMNKGFPLRVMFELTYRCNFYCRHCYVPQNYRVRSIKEDLKTKQIFYILDKLKDIGCFYLGFTGGKPFLRDDILKIMWHAKRNGFEIIINTNGSLINKKIAEELNYIKPNKVDITLHAMTKKIFEKITKSPGSYKKVFSAIELLHKNGINLGFKSCILRGNINEINKINRFANSLGALYRIDDMLMPRLDGSIEPYRYGCIPSLSRLPNPVNKCDMLEITNQSSVEHRVPITDNPFKCGVGISHAAITPFGELKMCVHIDYPKYNILDDSLENAWYRLKDLIKRLKVNNVFNNIQFKFKPYYRWCPARYQFWFLDINNL